MKHMVRRLLCLEMIAGLAFGAAGFEMPTPGHYVSRGLVAQWDAIDNAGTGEHDSTATFWKDLVGSRDMTLTKNGTWKDGDKLSCAKNGAGYAAGPGVAFTSYRTLEFAGQSPNSGTYNCPFTGGSADHSLFFSRGGMSNRNTGNYYSATCGDSTFAIAYDGDGNAHCFDKGVETTTVAGSDNFGVVGATLLIGGQIASGGYPYFGNMRSIRLYSVALTETELRYNAAIDKVRFFGADLKTEIEKLESLPTGITWDAANERVVVQASLSFSCAFGTFSADDGFFALGSHVSVTLTLNDGVKMPGVRWVGLPANAVFSDDGFTAEFDVMGDREISVVSLQPLESRNLMVADSVVAWWDGVDNAGTGVHDPAATVWKDLVGFRDLPLTSRGSFGETALVCGSGSTIAAGPATACTDYRTFEAVFAPRIGTGSRILFTGGSDSRALTLSRDGIRPDRGNSKKYKKYAGLDASFSAVYEDDGSVTLRENGLAMSDSTTDDFGGLGTSLAVGGSGLYPYVGNVYAIRLHSRPLAEDEVRYNAAIDRVRLLGERMDVAFDGVTVPSTAPVRWNATLGVLEVLFTARGDAFGHVSVDGGAAAAVVETWVPVGCAVTVAYVPTADLGFKRWDNAPAGTTFSADGLTAIVPVREKCGIDAVSNRPEARITEVVSVGATEVTLGYDVGAMEVQLKAVVSSGAQVTTNDVGVVSGTGTCVLSGLASGTAYEVKLLAERDGLSGESGPVSFTTNFRLMVRPDAAEGGDGRTWETAMVFSNALAAAETATRPTEIWVAGENVLSAAEPARQFAVPVTIRGGFAGGEALATDRAEGAVSAIDGADAFNPFRFSNATGVDVVLERLEIRRAYDRAIDKSGNGDLTLTACLVVSNGMGNAATRDGKAICVHDATVALITIVGTRFLDNRTAAPKNSGGKGACASFAGCRRVELRDCSFVGGGQALHAPAYNGQTSSGAAFVSSAPVVAENCRFVANFQGYWGADGGIVRLNGAAAGSSFSHCLWAGNEDYISWTESYDTNLRYAGSLVVNLSSAAGVVTVDSCTFAYNLTDAWRAPAGVNVACGDVRISNSVFGGNALSGHAIEKGVDIAVKAGSSCTVAYTVLSAATNGFTSAYAAPGASFAEVGDNVYGDPLFVTEPADFTAQIVESSSYASFKVDPATEAFLRNLDVHVRSAAGYFTNDGTELTAEGVQSCAIDAGDPLADWSNEPTPNGGRRNAGCYGNTAEASKSATGEPAVASVSVDFVDGMPRPRVTFTVGGTGVFSASATVSISTNGADWVQVGGQLTGLTRGDERSVTADLLLLPGTKAVAKVVLFAISSADEKSSDETEVTGELPIWYGRGGDPEKVVHVRAGAFGAGDGTSWGDAATDFNVALGLLTATRNELWIAGKVSLADNLLGRTFGFQVTIRGGFDGSENDAAARRAWT